MSVFSPANNPAIETHRRSLRDERAAWLGLSVLLHILAWLALIHLTPLRRALQAAARTEKAPLSANIIEELSRRIERDQLREMEKTLRNIEDLERALAQERAARGALRKEEPGEPAEDILHRALAEMRRAANAQQTALEILRSAMPDPETALDRLAAAEARLEEAETAQREALAELAGIGEGLLDEALQAQMDASARQTRARADLARAAQIRDTAAELGRQEQRAREEVRQFREREWNSGLREMERRKEEARRAEQERTAYAGELEKRRAEAASASAAAEKGAEFRNAAERARQALARAEREGERIAERAERAREALERAAARHTENERRLAEIEARAQAWASERAQRALGIAEALRAAAPAQEAAFAAQQYAMELLLSATARAPASGSADTPSAPPTPDASRAVAQVYERARASEARGTLHYREIRAAELALIQGTTLHEARRGVDVPMPLRRGADEIFTVRTPVRTRAGLEQLKRELTEARRQIEAMAAASEARLEAARRKGAAAEGALADAIREMVERERALADLSHEDRGGKIVDLTRIVSAPGRALPDPGDARRTPAPSEIPTAAPAAGQASASAPGPAEPQPPPRAASNSAPPQVRVQDVRAFGRRLTETGPATDWLAVNSWYVVGPFPNPQRQNIHREFPPEVGQGRIRPDLDAVYVGAEGRPVRWEFVQSSAPMVAPKNPEPYTIWYAYTELFLEESQDLWVALGSDDRSDVWVNGDKIWSSSDHLKAWNIGEGYRRVRFERGINRILYRIENGHGGIGFSFVVHTGESVR